MAPTKARYAVTFQNKAAPLPEAAELLKTDTRKIKNAVQTLRAASPLEASDILLFPELGVAYLELTAEEAESLAERDGVLQVRQARTLTAHPLLPPTISPRRGPSPREAAAEPIPWNISLVRANEVWGRVTGAGVKVGIMDSGIDRSHPDLTVTEGVSFAIGMDGQPITDWDDIQDGHGTQCAGIVGARRNQAGVVGVAPECSLYAIKVSRWNARRRKAEANSDWMLAGMVWAAEKRLDVVSMSLWDDFVDDNRPDEPAWLDMARGAELLLNSGCLLVGIAGNSGGHTNHWVANPARAEGIIAVGSVNQDRSWSSFSSYGPDELSENQGVELVAPGANVSSTTRGGTYADGLYGTSYACPHVSGAAALLKQLHPTWSPHQIRARLKQTADDLLLAGRDAKTGWGLLNCYRAVNEPIADDTVFNEMSGRVASVARQGESHLIRFTGNVSVRDWSSAVRMVADAVLVVSPPAGPSDVSLLASSIGRQLNAFGLLLADTTDAKLFRTQRLFSIAVS